MAGAAFAPAGFARTDGKAIPVPVSEPLQTNSVQPVYPTEVLRVVDGDTFEARVHVWPGLDVTTKVRLRGIDAPEFKARCAEEGAKAEAARAALVALLAGADVTVTRVSLDKYGGRVLADAGAGAGPDVASALLASGAVRPYDGGRRQSWCVAAESGRSLRD
jgi:endonuclease YncB( thermonuclease family)